MHEFCCHETKEKVFALVSVMGVVLDLSESCVFGVLFLVTSFREFPRNYIFLNEFSEDFILM